MEDEELLAWLYIRDLLFGRNFLKQDVVSAYRLSASCAHPDARFVFEALGRKPEDRIDAHNLLLKNGAPDCARTFWFCQMLLVDPYSSDTDCDEPEEDVRPNFDFPFALALQAGMSSRELGFELAKRAAEQGERDGFHALGRCYFHGIGCKQDHEKAKEWFLKGASLGCVRSMLELGELVGAADPARAIFWFGLAAKCGFPSAFVYTLQPDSGYDYLLGRELHGYVDEKAGLIFGCCFDVELAVKLQNVYLSQNRACRSTIDAWSIVGMRFGVCKDVRVLIAKLVVDLTLPPRILPELAKRILKHKPATNTWKDFVYEGR